MITSNTLVKDGMPFIGKVLEQVEPYMDEMIVTISVKCTDETNDVVEKFRKEHPDKVFVYHENVSHKAELTKIQQDMLDSSTGDWILFLSDDDYWPREELEKVLAEIDKGEDVLGYSVNPYQLIDLEHYDYSWRKKQFTKFFKREGSYYKGDWPRELIYNNGESLYWKDNKRVVSLSYKFYHLSYLKNHSFRTEDWAKSFRHKVGKKVKIERVII